ncbi:MAG: DNA repair protein RecN, partial [Cyanobacteria bacterium J06631_9]
QPLVEVASGGEMSRFLLALKACFSRVDPISTMVFDEIDVGVSGRVAQAIAEKLHHLSREHQVLCVTHQPLVAAMADAHYHVGKHVVTQGSQADTSSDKKLTAAERKALAKIAAQSEQSLGKSKKTSQKKSATAVKSAPASSKKTSSTEERTIVKVTPLNDTHARRDELAQLAGGTSQGEAIKFADSLLEQAAMIRKAG